MTTALATLTFDEMQRLAESIAKSGLFGMKTADQALALMAISAAEGIHPALAARDYYIVSGRPTLKADAMLARFQSAGGKMEMLDYTDELVRAKFSHPQGGSVTVDWTIERSKRAGLAGRDTWKSYPRQMLRARVISEGVRTVFPGATAGLLAVEEAADMPPDAERDVTPEKPEPPARGVAALAARIAAMKPETIPVPLTENASAELDPTTGEIFAGAAGEPVTFAEIADRIQDAIKEKNTDALIAAVALLPRIADEQQRAELDVMAREAWRTIKAKAA